MESMNELVSERRERRELAAERDVTSLVSGVERLTDNNDHTGAVIFLWDKVIQDQKGTKAAVAIQTLHDYFGSMGPELDKVRAKLRDEGIARIKAKLGSGISDKFNAVF